MRMSDVFKPLKQLLGSDVAIIAGGQLLLQALTVVTGVAIARMLQSSGYGVVNIVRNIFTALAILAPLGLDLALLKYIGRGDRDLASADRLVARLRLIVLLLNLPIVLIGGLLLGRVLMHHVYPYKQFDIMLTITLLALPISADLAVLSAYYRSRSRPGLFALMTLYVQPIARVLLVALAFTFAPGALAVVAINTLQIAISAIFVWTHYLLWRRQTPRPDASASAPPAKPARGPASEWALVRSVLGDSIWMAMSLFIYGMMRFVDILVLGAFAPARVVGAYAALSTVAQLVQVWPLATSQTLGPTVSRLYYAGDIKGMRRELSEYIQFASIAAGFIFGGVAAFGTQLDLVFGKSFVFDPGIAFLMPLGYLLSASLAPMGYALSMTGRHRAELVILAIGGVVLIGGCYLLTPHWQAIGAATAVCLTFALINISRFVYVSKTIGFIPGRLVDLVPPVIALALAYAAKALMVATLPHNLLSLLAGCVVYTVAYGSLIALMFLRGEGRQQLQRLLFSRGAA
jgi:O-antigen/teichoic acid export membrane protein